MCKCLILFFLFHKMESCQIYKKWKEKFFLRNVETLYCHVKYHHRPIYYYNFFLYIAQFSYHMLVKLLSLLKFVFVLFCCISVISCNAINYKNKNLDLLHNKIEKNVYLINLFLFLLNFKFYVFRV